MVANLEMKKLIKHIADKYFSSFAFFYRQLRYRVFLVVGLSILLGVLDGFGLTMFLPLLQMADGQETADPGKLEEFRFLLDAVHGMGLELTLTIVLAILVVFFILKGAARFASQSYLVIVLQYFIKKLRINLVQGLNEVSFKYFVTSDVGRIQNTVTGEVYRVANAFRSYFKAMEQGILVAVYIGFAFIIDAKFAFLVTIGGGLTNLIYNQIYKKTKGESRKLTAANHYLQGLIIQFVANFKYLKATGFLPRYFHKLKAVINKVESSNRNIGMLNAILLAIREPMMILIVAGVILIQVKIMGGELAPILISLLFFYRALNALMAMQNQWNTYLSSSGSMSNLFEFQEDFRSHREVRGKKQIARLQDGVVLENAYFSYGETKVLEEISLAIQKNETIAFVGESGSGKTTLVNILAGLMPLDQGRFLIDETPADQIDINTYQKRVGYITQDPVIFNDTIYNNVTLWATPTLEREARFEEALQKAAMLEFVNDLPQGKETMLGNNGINLSGGQKQRISIARELFKDIDILIMDEATSALDSETERAIQDNIEQLHGQYTILIVAHRLSTIKHADLIVFMENGQINNIGAYHELLRNTPRFKKMVELQEL
mgnify:CR=1 FL=1